MKASVQAAVLAVKPPGLSFDHAAAVPVAGFTALRDCATTVG
jgi:NADPH:quinone reductase-like Zn-dependent oxidoreductase